MQNSLKGESAQQYLKDIQDAFPHLPVHLAVISLTIYQGKKKKKKYHLFRIK